MTAYREDGACLVTSSMLFPTFPKPYFLDANVLISAWRDHYPPDLHPGFWEYVEHSFREGQLRSVDRVYEEIITPEDLIAWANKRSQRFFAFSGEGDVIKTYKMMQQWVQTNTQFLPVARYDFAGAADGWLAAYAKVHNQTRSEIHMLENEFPSRTYVLNSKFQLRIL